jgi:antitoxin PrlF
MGKKNPFYNELSFHVIILIFLIFQNNLLYQIFLFRIGNIMTCKGDTCRIDALVTMDVKGQIVLPKDLREKANIKPNDKIALVACEKEGEVCCIMMVKADRLVGAVTKALVPLLKAVTKEEEY